MTTYQEISTSKRLNRKFWNNHIKFLICMLREHQKINCDKSKAFVNSYKCAIEKAIESRRCFEYLIKG